jgi:hypothetical protein
MGDVRHIVLREKVKRDVWFSPFMMELRSIVLYLRLKGMNGRAIYDDLVTTLLDDAPAYSTVTSGYL